ncbi:hypothetical protein LCGC14_0268070 [marine sediment metagenome]|uniref:Uncharacterized protein n=1 Tax=marine sediment metagenome TaxID=412755 RepID=A0A0F9U070_9ZZZZ
MSEQEQETVKKKKKLTPEQKKERNMRRKLMRKAAKRYTVKIDPKLLNEIFRDAWINPDEMKIVQWERLIFNLLVKAKRNTPHRPGDQRCKYARTKEAFDLAYRIKIHFESKYMFRISGLSDYDRYDSWMERFFMLLYTQYNRDVTASKKGWFILEKKWKP